MMADRHKRQNRTIRLPEDLEKWLDSEAERLGKPFNQVVVTALALYRSGMRAPAPDRETRAIPRSQPRSMGYSKDRQTGKEKR